MGGTGVRNRDPEMGRDIQRQGLRHTDSTWQAGKGKREMAELGPGQRKGGESPVGEAERGREGEIP